MPTDVHRELTRRLLRFRSKPGSENPLSLAEDLISAGRYGDARGVVVGAQTGRVEDVPLFLLEARAWSLERDLARAQAVLLEAARTDPRCAQVYVSLAELMLKRGDPERALKTSSRALEIDPGDSQIRRLHDRASRLTNIARSDVNAESVVATEDTAAEAAPVVLSLSPGGRGQGEGEAVEAEPIAVVEPEPIAVAVEPEPVQIAEPEPVAVVEPEPVAVAEPEPIAVAEPEAASVVLPLSPGGRGQGEGEAVEAEPIAVVEPEPVAVAVEPESVAVVKTEAEPEPIAVAVEPEPVQIAEPEPIAVAVESGPVQIAEPEPIAVAVEPEPVQIAEPEPIAVAVEPEPIAVAVEPGPVQIAEPEPIPLTVRETLPRPEKTAISKQAMFVACVSGLVLLMSFGVYRAWQRYEEKRRAKAAEMISLARKAALEGEYARLADADRYLIKANTYSGGSDEFARCALLVKIQRAFEDGPSAAGPLLAAQKRAGKSKAAASYVPAASAVLASRSGDWEGARRQLAAALGQSRGDPVLFYIAGRVAARFDPKQAADYLQSAIGKAPEFFLAATIESAALKYFADQNDEAVALLDAALARSPKHLRASLWRLFITAGRMNNEQVESALKNLSVALAAGGPTDRVLAASVQGGLLKSQGKSNEAGALLERALKTAAGNPLLLELVARSAITAGELDTAKRAADQALAAAPVRSAYLRLQVEVAMRRGDIAEALQTSYMLPESDPRTSPLREAAETALLAHVDQLVLEKKLAEAEAYLLTMPRMARESPVGSATLARLALARGKPEEAPETFSQLASTGQLRPPLMVLYGYALYAAGRVDEAAGVYNAALKVDPQLPEALVGRAEVDVRAENPGSALQFIQRAQSSPATSDRPAAFHARMLTLKGHAYVQRAQIGDFEEAAKALSEAVLLPGVSVEAFFWLGEAQAGARRPVAATAAYQRYMALDPQGIYVERAKRALATRPAPRVEQSPDPVP